MKLSSVHKKPTPRHPKNCRTSLRTNFIPTRRNVQIAVEDHKTLEATASNFVLIKLKWSTGEVELS